MNVTITKQEVFDSVKRQSEYVGDKAEQYDKAMPTKMDDGLFDTYFHEALDDTCATLEDFVTGTDNETYVTLDLSNGKGDYIAKHIRNFMAQSVLAQWLTVVGIELAKVYEAKSAQSLKNARELSYKIEFPIK